MKFLPGFRILVIISISEAYFKLQIQSSNNHLSVAGDKPF